MTRNSGKLMLAFGVAGVMAFFGAQAAVAGCLDCPYVLKDCPQTCTAPEVQCPKKCNTGSSGSCVCNTSGANCYCTIA